MADVPSTLNSWSATASSNSPTDATTIGSGLADNLQALQAVVRGDLASVGSNIASSANPDVGAVQGLYHTVTGNNTIAGLGSTATAGIWKILEFAGTPPLIHNTALQLLGEATIQAAAGDVGIFLCQTTNQWKMVSYFKDALSPGASASASAAGVVELATQAEMETATDLTRAVSPGTVQYHPGPAKFWVAWATTGTTIAISHNVTSVTNTGTGDELITIATDFSTDDWVCIGTTAAAGGTSAQILNTGTKAAGTQQILITLPGSGVQEHALADSTMAQVAGFGDQT